MTDQAQAVDGSTPAPMDSSSPLTSSVGDLPPNSATPTGNLQQAVTPQDNPATDMPAPGVTPLGPRQSNLMHVLSGIGAAFKQSYQQQTQRLDAMKQSKVDQAQADVQFTNAKAAYETAQTHLTNEQYKTFDETHRADMESKNMETQERAVRMGYTPIAVTDTSEENGSASAMQNLQTISQNNNGVPANLVHLHMGDKLVTMQLNNPAASLDMVNRYLRMQGKGGMTAQNLLALPADDRNDLVKKALYATDPSMGGKITQDSLTEATNRRMLAEGQTPYNGQDEDVKALKATEARYKSVLDNEAKRANEQKANQITSDAAATASTALGSANVEKTQAEADKNQAEAKMLSSSGVTATDPFGYTSDLPQKELLKRQDAFQKDVVNKAQDTEKSFQMADGAYNEYKQAQAQGKTLPSGAQSMVLLSGHLQTTFGNVKGARVTKDMIHEHLGARSISDDALVAVQRLTNGDTLSPAQWDAFHELIGQSRNNTWQNAISNAKNQRLPISFLPQGMGQAIDKQTAQLYVLAAGGDTTKAAQAIKAQGWTWPKP